MTLKEKIENLIKTTKELKQRCFDLSNKYSEYIESLDWASISRDNKWNMPEYENFKNRKLNDLVFEFDEEDESFKIGYEHYACGDTDYYYSYFTAEEIIDENVIKQKIDNYFKEAKAKEAAQKKEKAEKDAAEKIRKEKYERDLLKKLKDKYEPEN